MGKLKSLLVPWGRKARNLVPGDVSVPWTGAPVFPFASPPPFLNHKFYGAGIETQTLECIIVL